MKKRIILAFSLALALFLTACGGSQSATSHLDQIKANGKIVLGTSADYPPFEYHEIADGKDTIVGWEIELAQAVAEELGVDLEIKEGSFATLIADVNSKKVDFVMSGMSIDPERAKSVDFSEPYFQGGQVLLTKMAKAEGLTDVSGLQGWRIGVQLGTTGEKAANEVAAEVEGVEVKSFDAFEAAILDLLSDRIDGVVADYSVAMKYAEQNEGLTVPLELTKEEVAAAFRKGDDELRKAVDQALATLKERGVIDGLIAKYKAAAEN